METGELRDIAERLTGEGRQLEGLRKNVSEVRAMLENARKSMEATLVSGPVQEAAESEGEPV